MCQVSLEPKNLNRPLAKAPVRFEPEYSRALIYTGLQTDEAKSMLQPGWAWEDSLRPEDPTQDRRFHKKARQGRQSPHELGKGGTGQLG